MLENDLFVRHNVCPVHSMNEIANYVRNNFGCSSKTADGAFLILAAYCRFITYEEIYETFPISSSWPISHCIPSLIKSGYLKKMSFPGSIGVSRSCFAITASGYRRANELCGGTIPNKYKPLKSDLSIKHSYLVGYNLFSMLSLSLPFAWRWEYPFTYGRGYTGNRSKGDLVVDARCSLFPEEKEKYRLLYFEEDTGAENAAILLDKLEKYRLYRLMDDDCLKDAVIFSFADKDAGITPNSRTMDVSAYSHAKCMDLINYMEVNALDDAFSLISNPVIDQGFLKEILTVTGAVAERDSQLIKGRFTLTRDALKEYALSLMYRRNPYQHREFNRTHSILSFRRMVLMAELMLSDVGGLPLYAWQMAKGFPVFCMPTTLVSERLPFALLSEFPTERDKVQATLSSYFADLKYESELSRPLTISRRGNSIRLRNIFSYEVGDGKRGLISVEFLSFDLSAWIRAALFLNYMRTAQEIPVQLICVFETSEHYKRFFKMLKIRSDTLCITTDNSGVYGLMLYDVGKEHKIFTIVDDVHPEKIELLAAFRSDEE